MIGTCSNFLNTNKDELRNKFTLIRIGLFGSYAKDNATKDSDIDFYAEFEVKLKNMNKLLLLFGLVLLTGLLTYISFFDVLCIKIQK